ncbi:MAG TPA: hypothetical protein VGF12_06990 [Roseateles sp.]|uniref:phage tail tip fiber protein n=1 Tax=Roseateles sp. TaxID=1971397 RepID=UPI002EDB48B4
MPEGLGEGLSDFLGQLRRLALDITSNRVQFGTGVRGAGTGSMGGSGGSGGGPVVIAPPGTDPDLTAPPDVAGLSITAGFAQVIIEWNSPIYTQGRGNKRTILYAVKMPSGAAGPAPTFPGEAGRVYETPEFLSTVSLPSDLGITWHVWAKFESNDGVKSVSPAGGINGVTATTGKIGNEDLGDLIIEAGNIADGAVGPPKFVPGLEPVGIVDTVPLVKTTSTVFNTTDGKLYFWDDLSGAYVPAVGGTADSVLASNIVGLIASAQIAGIAASQITGTLSNSQLAAIDAAKVTGQITATQIANNSISTPKLQAGAITANEIAAGSIVAGKIAAGAVTATELSAGSVTTAKLTAGAVTANELAAGSVVAGKIAALSIVAGDIAAGTITGNKIAVNTITAGLIQAGQVNATHLAANSIAVGSAAIQNGAIVNAMIANATIDDAKIASLSVAKLQAGSLAASQYIQSSNYVPGSTGFRLNADGTAEFGSATVRGTITANAVNGATGTLGAITLGGLITSSGKPSFDTGSGIMLGVWSGNAYLGITRDMGGGVIRGLWMGTHDGVLNLNGALVVASTINNPTINNPTLDAFTVGALSNSTSSGGNTNRTYVSRTATPSGGKAPFTYRWSLSYGNAYGTAGSMTMSGADSATVTVSGYGFNCIQTGYVTCDVTDANGRTAKTSFLITATHGTPGPIP